MGRQAHIVSIDDARRARAGRVARSASGRPGSERSPERPSPASSAAARRVSQGSGTLFADEDFYQSLNFTDEAFAGRPRHASPRVVPFRSSGLSSDRITETYEEEAFEEQEDVEVQRKGLLGRLSDKRKKAKRSKAKEKAGKKFASQYGDSGPSDASAGPRAAVYKGEMGAQHKRATRMQGDGPSGSQKGFNAAKPGSFKLAAVASSRVAIALGGVAVCVLLCAGFLYQPAQQFYQEMRERDRLAIEYEAIQQRNENLEASVAYLSTDEGVEDRAREEFGWIKDGERAVSVSGITIEEETNFTANILSSDIKPPETWYSRFLDPLFGVE